MIFKASFTDGTAEILQANQAGEARYQAVKLFPGKIVAKVEVAGLLDMAKRRPAPTLKSKLTR
jgi:hypothetical protein